MKRKHRRKIPHLLLVLLPCLLALFLLSFLSQRLEPSLKEISHMQCKNMANEMIDASVSDLLKETNAENITFFSSVADGYTIDAVKVNQFCTQLSTQITSRLTELQYEKIRIPLGAATKWSLLANTGPAIPFTLLPKGAAKVDYSTDFASTGINQVNYKIWIDISIEIKIVNPLYHENIILERKMMLADIVFSGKVPDHFFQLASPQEYLLTE